MASVTQKVPNYVLGISTQPDEKKIPGQVVDLVNGVPDVVNQLQKRPGSQLVKEITTTSNPYGDSKTYAVSTAANAKWFNIYSKSDEQYIGQCAADGTVNVWRTSDGASIPVDYSLIPGTLKATYLDNTKISDAKSSDIQVMTINETTFFVNRKTSTAMLTGTGDLSPASLNEAFISLDTISYGKQYALDIFDPDNNTLFEHTRATSIEVGTVSDSSHYSGTSNGDCLGMGREIVDISTGTDMFGTSPPNMSAGGKSRLRYEMDIRCTPQPTAPVDDSYSYHDTYQAFPKLQFGGEGWSSSGPDTHAYTSEKGVTTTIKVLKHQTIKSRCNVAGVRPDATSSTSEENVSAAMIVSDLKATLDAISGTGLTATICGNGLHLYRATPFGVTTPEKSLMSIATSEVNNIADLPRVCRHGYVVRVVNSGEDMDDYYLRFQAEGINADISKSATYSRSGTTVTVTAADHGLQNNDTVFIDFTSGGAGDGHYTVSNRSDGAFELAGNSSSGTISGGETCTYTPARFGEGVWEEVAAPGIEISLDKDTMPLQIKKVDGSTTNTIATSDVNTSTEVITINNHGMLTTQAVTYSNGGGTTLAGLSDGTTYYVIKVDANSIKLATSAGNANSGTAINLTGTGNNAQTITDIHSINGGTARNYSNGWFQFSYPDWGQRDVGDDITNSKPTFIGNPIQKMVFFRNRIGLLSNENIILSRVNDFYSFWVKTAMAISNADPIDLQSSSNFPTKLYDAVEAGSGLIIYSASEQFLLSSGAEALLTPETAKIGYLSSYGFNPDTVPISLGLTTGFLNSTARQARFYEMAGGGPKEEPVVQEQTKIISELFPQKITSVCESNENDLLLFGVDSTLHPATNEVWGYKYFETGGKRSQSAWFRWTMPNKVIYHTILDDVYYAVLSTGSNNKFTLEKFDIKLTSDTPMIGTAPNEDRVHLDTKKTIATGDITYDTQNDVSTFTLGSGYYSDRTLTAYCIADSDAAGKSYDIPDAKVTGTAPNETVTLPGNWKTSTKDGSPVNTDLIIGYEYEFEVELPKIYITQTSGETVTSETRGSLTIHRMNFDFGDVGVIDVTLQRRGRDPYTYTVESLEWDNILSSTPTIARGYLHTIPVYDRNENLTVLLKSNHPSPATIHSMNWEGDYSPRYYQRV